MIKRKFSFNYKINAMLPIITSGIYIAPMMENDISYFRDNTEIRNISDYTCRPVRDKSREQYVKDVLKFSKADNTALLGLFANDNGVKGELLGRVSLFDYNSRNKSAELGYWLIDRCRGKGYMHEAIKEIIKNVLGHDKMLNKLYAQTASFNMKSISLLENLNFTKDATLRQHHEKNGIYYDDYIFSIIASDLKTE